MAEGARLVHIVDDVTGLDGLEDGPVLVHALEGFLDAGNAAQLAATHLLGEESLGPVVASFETDELYDYRARRPPMVFAEDHYTGYEIPRLVVRLQHDDAGTPYLLLHGPEPDTQWEAFCAAVRRVVEHFGVRLTVGLGSVPMAVPHTRPVNLTNHATRTGLLTQANVWRGEIRVPSSAQALVELRLGEAGHDAMGYVAHIPHYVSQFDYPHAAAALLEAVGSVAGLTWQVQPLRTLGEEKLAEITAQVDDSEEVQEVVQGLERQYDAFHRTQQSADGAQSSNLLAQDQDLPTGEELGAEFEQFLAGLNRPDRPEE